jgi:tripartite-type tricarboxylate transporter receptor subunit TctC
MFQITRVVAVALAALCLTSWSAAAAAQAAAWPSRPVKFVVPSGPGGSPDRVTRLLADRLSKKWGQPVIVENKAGATAMIGTEYVAKSDPNGYTFLSTFTSYVQVPALFKKYPYDPEKDFVPVTQTVSVEVALLVRADSPYKTLRDFTTAAKNANPPLSFGSFGTGSSFHIYGEKLAQSTGIHLIHVPYKGEAAAVSDLLGGQISSAFSSIGTALPFLKTGRVRALGLVSHTRSKALPEVPTLAELGVPPPDVAGWFGILAPAGTPSAIVDKVAADVKEILTLPEVAKTLRDQGLEPVASTPQKFGELLRTDLKKWKKLLPELGVMPSD